MLPDVIDDPLDLLERDLTRARSLGDPAAGFGCLATVDAEGQPHARMVTFRVVHGACLQFWSFRTSPKVKQLEASGRYELTIWWSSILRQYRLQGEFEWAPAGQLALEYAALPPRARVWDRVHEELPQSSVLPDGVDLVRTYEAVAEDLVDAFGRSDAVPPSANAGAVRLFPRRIEVEAIDMERRIHDRRLLVLERGAWSQRRLVP